jgi:hypothetical protein
MSRRSSRVLAVVERLARNGMPVSALRVARSAGVQFNERTLRKWRSGDGPLRTYAWLAMEAEVVEPSAVARA